MRFVDRIKHLAGQYLGLFDDKKVETKHPISEIRDLYAFAEPLREGAMRWADA